MLKNGVKKATDIKMNLKLLVYNMSEKEVLVDFYIDFDVIQGFYDDPDDDSVINLLSYGQLYTVVRSHALMNKLKSNEN